MGFQPVTAAALGMLLIGLAACPLLGQTPQERDGLLSVSPELELMGPSMVPGTASPRLGPIPPHSFANRRSLVQELEAMEHAYQERKRRVMELMAELVRRADEADRARKSTKQGHRAATETKAVAVEHPPKDQQPAQQPTPSTGRRNTLRDPAPLSPAEMQTTPNRVPQLIVEGSVDKLALANNLFVEGTVDVAASIYAELAQLPQEPSDLVWIQYQLAACYRMLGRIKDAEKLYRIVVSSKDEYWSSRANWWLRYLSRTGSMMERQTQLKNQMQALEKEINELQPK